MRSVRTCNLRERGDRELHLNAPHPYAAGELHTEETLSDSQATVHRKLTNSVYKLSATYQI